MIRAPSSGAFLLAHTWRLEVVVKLFDIVVLVDDIEGSPITSEMHGTIVEVLTTPIEAYGVEFCDDEGRTIAVETLLPEQIMLVLSP